MSGWGSTVWPDDFGPPENLASGFPPDFFVFRGTDQKWGSVHVPERLVRQRPWPTIQGRLHELDEAIAWFEHIAAISGIMLVRLAPGTGQAGLYSLQERAIYLADELFELPPLYGWVLATSWATLSTRASKPSVQWSTANPSSATERATTNWWRRALRSTRSFLSVCIRFETTSISRASLARSGARS